MGLLKSTQQENWIQDFRNTIIILNKINEDSYETFLEIKQSFSFRTSLYSIGYWPFVKALLYGISC